MREATLPIAIIGTGFGGLGMAYYLKKAGFHDLTLFEKSHDVGGVWRDNTYPGAACDVPSHLYSFSFEPTYTWSRRYPQQPEILAYLRGCAQKHDLHRHIRFGCEVIAATFDDARGVWTIELAGGAKHEARVLISAVGQLNRPVIPEIKGQDSFRGAAFHSARWDHGCELRGKRVAVVGTGASAAQFVPEIVRDVKQLYVFQRSAAWTWPKYDRAYSRWERFALKLAPQVQLFERVRIFSTLEGLGFASQPQAPTAGAARKLYERISRRMREGSVSDPALLTKLTPDYPLGCKRVLLTNEWLPALTSSNVEVVTSRIDELTPTGVHTEDGTLREVDVVIYGTGFAATDFLAPMDIRGLSGRSLREEWREGAQAYLGMAVTGFPNLFLIYGPNTNLGAGSIVYMLERQARYVVQCVEEMRRERLASLEVRQEAQRVFNEEIRRRSKESVFEEACHSWYTTNGLNTNNWIGPQVEYALRVRRPRFEHYLRVSA